MGCCAASVDSLLTTHVGPASRVKTSTTLGGGTETLSENVNELTDQEDIRSQLHPGKAENLPNYVVKIPLTFCSL
jgi:hypothetical protein